MNDIIQQLQQHRSVRAFSDKKLTDEQLDSIMEAAIQAPNWINGQQVSVVVVTDSERKRKLATLSGNQKHVDDAAALLVFCMDYSRNKQAAAMHNKEIAVMEDIEAVIVGSTDVGIALGTAVAAAESMGLGTVPIGGVRRRPAEVTELLELPALAFPISGLAVGYSAEPASTPRPRIPMDAFYHKETYKQNQQEAVDEMDKKQQEATGVVSEYPWSERIAAFYADYYKEYRHVAEALKQQGYNYK
ncbi:NADPH-dependent oxidoreductase [Paraliobacillus ryukyuensis]|uniref:NADPH-dependent oxidoreductase n=1 Tax=Paraliobacillus ryukyuensis TaxID=200904 RepID=UPI0009A7E748|nr:NADPH-dependent oxidoreductase [Paraliobacillus ryukyuensis]